MKSLILSVLLIFFLVSTCTAKNKNIIYIFKKRSNVVVFTNIAPLKKNNLKLIKIVKFREQHSNKNIYKKTNIVDILKKEALTHKVDYKLIRAVAEVESGLKQSAVSNKGAKGIMQLMPETAKRFGVKDITNVSENIKGGVKYLKYLLKKFNYNYKLALAAYNAGENAVLKYKSIPPYRETKNYVKKVFLKYRSYLSNERFF